MARDHSKLKSHLLIAFSSSSIRYRTCTNPSPQFGGIYCNGSAVRLLNCTTNITCPGTDTWGAWSALSGCSVTCGNGTRTSYRNCTPSASAAFGSASCNGSSVNVTSCFAGVCPSKIFYCLENESIIEHCSRWIVD